MKTTLAIVSLLVLATALVSVQVATAGGNGQPKIVFCHVPPGNPANAHTIVTGNPAAARPHLGPGLLGGGHGGDYLGPCGQQCTLTCSTGTTAEPEYWVLDSEACQCNCPYASDQELYDSVCRDLPAPSGAFYLADASNCRCYLVDETSGQ